VNCLFLYKLLAQTVKESQEVFPHSNTNSLQQDADFSIFYILHTCGLLEATEAFSVNADTLRRTVPSTKTKSAVFNLLTPQFGI
jgi:hypothetical protein